MGDIRRTRKKYSTPGHPWNKERIELERAYSRKYGLQNKKELWKVESKLKDIKDQIKKFPTMSEEQRSTAEQLLRARLKRMGLIDDKTMLGEVLGYETDVLLDRRLQTIVHKKGLARSAKQARQMITHEHITVNGKTVNSPGYLVLQDEEATIAYHSSSPFVSEMHPERQAPEKKQEVKKEVKVQEEQPEVVELTEEDKDLE